MSGKTVNRTNFLNPESPFIETPDLLIFDTLPHFKEILLMKNKFMLYPHYASKKSPLNFWDAFIAWKSLQINFE